MSEEKSEHERQAGEPYAPPAWLHEVLVRTGELSGIRTVKTEEREETEVFRRRCSEAADFAVGLLKLRKEVKRLGFVQLSLKEYVEGVAKVTGVDLLPVLSRFGVGQGSGQSRAFPEGWVRLARRLGIGARQCLVHCRIELAQVAGAPPIAMLAAHRRSTHSAATPRVACENLLEEIESDYARDTADRLKEIEAGVHTVYDEPGLEKSGNP
jgi:hypothetical protein